MDIKFEKYQGAGNDFIMIDNRDKTFPEDQKIIEKWCSRKWGIGADGLILIENEKGYDFKMVYFNSDGKRSTMCGNGGRCAVAHAYSLGIFTHLQDIHFLAADGLHTGSIIENLNGKYITKISMKDVESFEIYNENSIILNTGSPHFVTRQQNIQKLNIVDVARSIRYNDQFKVEGINVNFIESSNEGELSIRTYERGVEDETLSCGTGVVAAAIAADYWNLLPQNHEIKAMGGTLSVDFKKKGTTYTDIYLTGPANHVFTGYIKT